MKVLLVRNPSSGSASGDHDHDAIERALGALGDLQIVEPSSPEAFPEEVRTAASPGSLVVVAGGDGTLSLAVNSLADRLDDVVFGLLPMGTGNDFAREMDIEQDGLAAARAIVEGAERSIDLGVVSAAGVERRFVNACMGGFPVQVDHALGAEVKRRLGPFAFWWGGAKAATNLQHHEASVEGETVTDVVALGIGNGRFVGGGIEVFPEARPDDGRLEACAMPAGGLAEALQLALKVRDGDHVELPRIQTWAGDELAVEATPALEFNVDGEVIGLETPAHFEIAGSFRLRR